MANLSWFTDPQFGEYITYGCDIHGQLSPGEHRYPCYTCGHCSRVICLRPERTRDRLKCDKCNRYICEKSQLCRMGCTPLRDIAKDRVALNDERYPYLNAILAGVTDKDEAQRRQLIIGE